jgi:hypothetical protein
VLTYAIDGQILTLTAAGRSTPQHRSDTLMAIRTDANVPYGARLLMDDQATTEILDHGALRDRVAEMIHALGPKLAPVCAVVGPSSQIVDNYLFQKIPGQAGLQVGLFSDVVAARHWLRAYVAS